MTFLRDWYDILRDELRSTTNDLLFAYASRAGVTYPLGAYPLAGAEGRARSGENSHGDSPSVSRSVPTGPLAAAAPQPREGEGAHPESAGHGASPRAEAPPRGVSRPDPMVQVRHLLELIAGEKCSKVTTGWRCWGDPSLTPDCPWEADRWCDACTAQVALDALTADAYLAREVQR